MVIRRSAALLVALDLLAACGGGSPPTSPTGSHAPDVSASPGVFASLRPTAEASVGADAGTLTGTIVAGEAAGSATVDPFGAAVIQATGPDGSTYQLDIEAASVRHPTVVSLRPLVSVAFDGATLLAGVEIEPSGLQLFAPAVLTIIPATAAGATMPTAMEYVESSDTATARIAAVTATSSVASYQLVLTHFSGGFVTSLTPDTETSLFEAFSSSHALPNTPEGRQAQAETGLRTIKWAQDHDRIDHETATRRTADYEQQWWEAEADRVRDDPGLRAKINGGDPADADTVSTEVARMIEAAKRVQDAGGDPGASMIEAIGLAAEYGQNLANSLRSDPAFQTTLNSGLVSDLPQIADTLGLLASLAHQLALLGSDDAANLMIQAWNDFFAKMATAIGASCSQAPIAPVLAVGLTRQAALIGQEAAVAALQDCLPTPPACPGAFQPGMGMTVAALTLGRSLAATNACVPLGYAFAASWPHEYGSHPPASIGAVSCTADLSGKWAVLSLGIDEGLKVDTLIDTMNDPTNRLFVQVYPAGEVFLLNDELPYQAVVTPSEGPVSTVKLDITLENKPVYSHVYQLSPVTGSTMPNVCLTG